MLTESGFEIKSSHLGKLENLDLSHNNIFNDNILSHLRGLSSLKSLDLSYNMLLGSMTVNGTFFNSSTLEELYLDNTFSPNKLSSGHWSIACSSSIVCW
nr:receptor-like protein CLAVATA2 [Populus alba]